MSIDGSVRRIVPRLYEKCHLLSHRCDVANLWACHHGVTASRHRHEDFISFDYTTEVQIEGTVAETQRTPRYVIEKEF
jgi:hypothetical protein